MRRTLATLVLAAAAVAGTSFASPASAVCGGGAPGEPCYCPSDIKVGKYTIPTGVQC